MNLSQCDNWRLRNNAPGQSRQFALRQAEPIITDQSICFESTGPSLSFLTSRAISRHVTSSV
jgi:hypothetical protein